MLFRSDAWNKGIQFSTGEYVGIVDSTNILNKGAITTLVQYINANLKVDFFLLRLKRVVKFIQALNPKILNLNLIYIPPL